MTVFDRPDNFASQTLNPSEVMKTVLVIHGAMIILIKSSVAMTPDITESSGFTWVFGNPKSRHDP
jgi:hypothetical protein